MFENQNKLSFNNIQTRTYDNKNELNFYILNSEFDEEYGLFLKPWMNQFPHKLYPSKIQSFGRGGIGYSINLFNSKIIISTSSRKPSRWSILYNCYYFEKEKYQNALKNFSFLHPENMLGTLNSVETDLITGVHSVHGGHYSQCGIRLNCIYLELSLESWIYIRKDHPIITKEIDRKKVKCIFSPHCGHEEKKNCYQIYYDCVGPFEWIKIRPSELKINIDQWTNFWGMNDLWNLKEKDKNYQIGGGK